mmetsp:Transcript_3319/g.10424  ORF Transcript_3319/g.10424 Transcript_3319/m.10424 type:complete len:239 (+) Transcript_3319:355-1071(+)
MLIRDRRSRGCHVSDGILLRILRCRCCRRLRRAFRRSRLHCFHLRLRRCRSSLRVARSHRLRLLGSSSEPPTPLPLLGRHLAHDNQVRQVSGHAALCCRGGRLHARGEHVALRRVSRLEQLAKVRQHRVAIVVHAQITCQRHLRLRQRETVRRHRGHRPHRLAVHLLRQHTARRPSQMRKVITLRTRARTRTSACTRTGALVGKMVALATGAIATGATASQSCRCSCDLCAAAQLGGE